MWLIFYTLDTVHFKSRSGSSLFKKLGGLVDFFSVVDPAPIGSKIICRIRIRQVLIFNDKHSMKSTEYPVVVNFNARTKKFIGRL